MSAAEIKPKKLRKSKGAFGKDGIDPRKAAAAAGAASDEAPKADKKRKAEADDVETPAAAAAPVEEEKEAEVGGDDAEAKKEKKRLKKEKKAAKAALAAAAAEASAPLTQAEIAVAPSAVVEEQPTNGKKAKKDKKKAQKTTFGEDAAPVSDAAPASAPAAEEPAVASSSKYVAQKTVDSAGEAFLATHAVTVSHPYQPMLSFANLPISAKLSPAFKDFKEPSPIQACSWPPLFDGKDVVGIAETGSGKTLGFGIPAAQHLINTASTSKSSGKVPAPQVLVVSPTRELALQTAETLTMLCDLLKYKAVCLYGGMPKPEQVRLLNQKDLKVVVGTPGRVLDLLNDGAVSFDRVTYLVLDEADRMLDKGFENDIRQIIAQTPTKGRQTLMFSATWPDSVRGLAATFMKEPVRITVGSDELAANTRVSQNVEVFDTSRDKDPRLLSVLRAHSKDYQKAGSKNPLRILVFALYKKEATRLEQTIKRAGFAVAGLHGDMGQRERMAALEGFKTGEVGILVATDVAARGLDIPDVSLVLNVTFPLTVEDYIHRIGRTGRGGKSGKSITFFTGENHETALAGEFMRVLRDAGAEIPKGMDRFPSTIKKREHGSYGAFFKDTSDAPAAKKIKFDF